MDEVARWQGLIVGLLSLGVTVAGACLAILFRLNSKFTSTTEAVAVLRADLTKLRADHDADHDYIQRARGREEAEAHMARSPRGWNGD